MAMQSGVVYGRLILSQAKQILFRRTVTTETDQIGKQSLRLITAYCGFAKYSNSHYPKKKFIYGEDAFFIAENTSAYVLGVADGVGGWRDYGIDASKFSTTLMRKCESFVKSGGLKCTPNAKEVIKEGFRVLTEEKTANYGSSTACVIVFDKEKKILNSANLGDSGFIVFRKGQVLHCSAEQQHYFNTPYQLACPPPEQEDVVIQDSIEEADISSIVVEDGDIIVLGTDGLFDNLSIHQISREIQQLNNTSQESLQYLANCLAGKALKLAYDENYFSPFALHARKEGISITGGKPDDITVLISLVSCNVDF